MKEKLQNKEKKSTDYSLLADQDESRSDYRRKYCEMSVSVRILVRMSFVNNRRR